MVVVRKLVSGAVAMSAVSTFRLAIQFLILPILSRVLTPKEYGVVAMVMPFVILAMAISDAGLGAPLIRHRTVDPVKWSSAFWLVCLFGLGLGLLLAVLAPVLAWVYKDPEVLSIALALSVVLVMQAFNTIPAAYLQREQRFGTLAVIDMTAIIGGVVAAIALAYAGAGAWALVGQQFAYWLLRVAGTWIVARPPIKPILNIGEIREELRFGVHLANANAVNFASRSLDVFLVGIYYATTAVGFYSMALQFARLPATLIMGPMQSVIFSTLVRLRDDPASVRSLFLALTAVIASIVLPVTAVVAGAHAPIFRALLSARWQQAGGLYMLLMPGTSMQAVVFLVMPYLVALGRPEVQFRLTVEYTVIYAVFIAVAVNIGVDAVAIAIDLAMILYVPRVIQQAFPIIGCKAGEYLAILLPPIVIAAAAAFFASLVAQAPEISDKLRVLVAIVIAAIAVLLSLIVLRGPMLRVRNLRFAEI